MLPDGGFQVDAGWTPHNGTPETGVPCGMQTCTPGTNTPTCCIGFSGTTCEAACMIALTVACDGPEDCNTGDLCCLGSTGAQCATGACPPGGLIPSTQLCNVSTDCPTGFGCCESATINGYLPGISVGACVEGCGL